MDERLHALDRWQMSGSMRSIAEQNITVHVHEWLHSTPTVKTKSCVEHQSPSLLSTLLCNLPLQIQAQKRSININHC